MLKRFAVFAVAVSVISLHAYAQTSKTEQAKDAANPSHQAMSISIQQDNSASLQAKSQQHIDGNIRVLTLPSKDWQDKTAFWINLALAVAGFAGIWVAICTLRKIERQTKATEKGADAARLSVQSLIDAERAWIAVRIEGDILCGEFKAIASNQGRTPATIISWDYGFAFTNANNNWELPVVPDYFSQMTWMRGILVAPQNQFPAVHAPEPIYNALIGRRSKSDQLCVYGRIVYWHIFSSKDDMSKACETRWCFRFREDARDYIPYGGEYDRAT